MLAYIISLHPPDSEDNSRLASLLERNGYTVCFVKAIYGRDMNAYTYFTKVQSYLQLTGFLLSPGQLGNALSHAEAYKALLSSSETRAIILEDDVILDDEACAKLSLLLSLDIEPDSFIHLGGQDGLEFTFRHARGILRHRVPRVFEVVPDDLCYVHRVVGYVISRNTANILASSLSLRPFLLDDFSEFRKVSQIRRFYFTQIVRHSPDVRSLIESERELNAWMKPSGNSLFSRIIGEVNKTITHRREEIRRRLKFRNYTYLIDEA
jgi:glycosyl transferase, family 25